MHKRPVLLLLVSLILMAAGLACRLASFSPQAEPTAAPTATLTPTLAPTFTPTPKVPRTVRVAPDGSGDIPTLNQAVAELAAGSTILLDAGTYELPETLLIEHSLTIQGMGKDVTAITSSDPNGVLDFSGPGNIVLQGIHFKYQGAEWSSAVEIANGGFEVRDCRFSGGGRDLEENIGGNGLTVKETGNGSVFDSHFIENQHHGLAIWDQVNALVENCIFESNGSSGLSFWDSSVGIVKDSESSNNMRSGFATQGQSSVTFEDNVAFNNES